MIKHLVMFKFKNENKDNNILEVKKLLEALENKISVIKSLEIGINFDTAPRAMDLSINLTFNTVEDLNSYVIHDEHQKVVTVIKNVTEYSKVVDYII